MLLKLLFAQPPYIVAALNYETKLSRGSFSAAKKEPTQRRLGGMRATISLSYHSYATWRVASPSVAPELRCSRVNNPLKLRCSSLPFIHAVAGVRARLVAGAANGVTPMLIALKSVFLNAPLAAPLPHYQALPSTTSSSNTLRQHSSAAMPHYWHMQPERLCACVRRCMLSGSDQANC